MKVNRIASSVLVVVACFVPMLVNATGGEVINEAAITAKVKSLLAVEHDIPSLDISVTTKDHVVYLVGEVDRPSQAHRVVEIAQSVKGVKEVNDSQLTLNHGNSYLQDAMITAHVKGKILQLFNDGKVASGYQLSVDTADGEVYVRGKVSRNGDIKQIKEMVNGMKNVKNAHFEIEVLKHKS